jgi:hypothetical protein
LSGTETNRVAAAVSAIVVKGGIVNRNISVAVAAAVDDVIAAR